MSIFTEIKADYRAFTAHGTGKLEARISAILFSRGLHLLASYRLQRRLLKLPVVGKFIAKALWYVTSCVYGCEISYQAKLAGGIYIPHTIGIVIGEGAEIGTGTSIFQQVTIGGGGMGDKSRQRIGNHVFLGVGCKILGNLTLGDNAAVGANAVVLQSVPKGKLAVGVPAVIKNRKNK